MTRFSIELSTDGNTDIINLNPELSRRTRELKGDGLLHLFAVGSTCALTTIEFEPGLIKHDLKALLQKLIPEDARYEHEMTWNDDNGHSHLRASLIGAELTIPYANGRLLTGEYQQVVFVDFDTRPRKRIVIATVIA
jgi:secondary thiamine-phosphate synthase enzyme